MLTSRRSFFALLAAAPAVGAVAVATPIAINRPAEFSLPHGLAVRDMVVNAMRFMGLLAPGELPNRDEMDHGIRTLAGLIQSFGIPRQKMIDHPGAFQYAMTWCLASDLAVSYGRTDNLPPIQATAVGALGRFYLVATRAAA